LESSPSSPSTFRKRERVQKFIEYTERFSRFKNPEYINEVRRLLKEETEHVGMEDMERADLKPFEIGQLGNLCPKDTEEAVAIIPRSVFPLILLLQLVEG